MTQDRGAIEAVIFDWGGTLTPWHEVDLGEQWRVYAREVHGIPLDSADVPHADLEAAHELAERVLAAEATAWARGRSEHSSAHLEAILRDAGADPEHDRHLLALAAYRRFWEPHTVTDPQVRPLWEGLRDRGIRVGVLSNTIWTRDYHREIFARDGVLELLAIRFTQTDDPAGHIDLDFAGGGTIRLSVECLEARLQDLGAAWAAKAHAPARRAVAPVAGHRAAGAG